MFHHSCGHDRKRPNGLCVNSIRKGFGGKQPKMRETQIEFKEYLGPFVGHILTLAFSVFQSMVFVTSDVGPYWMTAAESELNRKDHLTTKTTKSSGTRATC
jgi:hypothetical protein